MLQLLQYYIVQLNTTLTYYVCFFILSFVSSIASTTVQHSTAKRMIIFDKRYIYICFSEVIYFCICLSLLIALLVTNQTLFMSACLFFLPNSTTNTKVLSISAAKLIIEEENYILQTQSLHLLLSSKMCLYLLVACHCVFDDKFNTRLTNCVCLFIFTTEGSKDHSQSRNEKNICLI